MAERTTSEILDAAAEIDVKPGDWIVTSGFLDLYGPVVKATASMVSTMAPGSIRTWHKRRDVILFAGSETKARQLQHKLKSMQGDHERRVREAEQRHQAALRQAAADARQREEGE